MGAGIFLDLAFPLENPRRTDVALVDSSVSGSISLDRGSYDGDYLHLCVCKQGKLRTERTQFTQSGSFNPSFAEGLGGVRVFGGDIGPLDPPALDFDGIEWVGNAGSIGPALSIQYGQCDLNVRNSLFRENKAYKLVSVLIFSIDFRWNCSFAKRTTLPLGRSDLCLGGARVNGASPGARFRQKRLGSVDRRADHGRHSPRLHWRRRRWHRSGFR